MGNKRRGVARFLHWAWTSTYILLTNSSEEFDLWEIQKKYSELLDNYLLSSGSYYRLSFHLSISFLLRVKNKNLIPI